MKISSMATLDLHEARGAVALEAYGRVLSFDYPNYDVDAKPNVLVLGSWTHPTTRNNLVGGINLNYIDTQQLGRLRDSLDKILRVRGLQARYRLGRRLLPDIFGSFYRTYNRDFINAVRPDTLKFGAQATAAATQKRKDTMAANQAAHQAQLQQTQQDQLAQLQAQQAQQAAQAGQQVPTPQARDPETLQRDVDQTQQTHLNIDNLRAVQDRQRQGPVAPEPANVELPVPQQQQPLDVATIPPDPAVGPGSSADQAIDNGMQPQDMPDFEQPDDQPQDSIDDLLGKLKKRNQPPASARPTPGTSGDSPGPAAESNDYFYSPRLGVMWRSPQAYIEYHRPSRFLAEQQGRVPPLFGQGRAAQRDSIKCECPLLAVYDLRSGITVIDRATNHSRILQEAGWDYDHTIRLLPTRTGVVPLCDDLPNSVIRMALRRIPRVVYEALSSF